MFVFGLVFLLMVGCLIGLSEHTKLGKKIADELVEYFTFWID